MSAAPVAPDMLPASAEPTLDSRRPLRLWLLGVGMLAPALAFADRYPLRGNSGGLTDIGKMADYGVAEFVGYVCGIVALFAVYGLAIREARRLPAERAMLPVFTVGAALVAAMAWMYPVNAIDLFIYSVRSRLFTTHGENPLAVAPDAYPNDQLMQFASAEWADYVSPYGPLWNLIAAPATLIGGDDIGTALALFKALAAIAVMLGAWLIYSTLAGARPGDAATGALFYLWNPLVLWEGVGNGHNDVVMVVPLLLALLAWTRGRDRFVIPLLIVAALIKYVTVLLIPLAIVAILRRHEGWRDRFILTAWSALLSGLAMLVALFPFYDVGAVRRSISGQGEILLTSPAAVAVAFFRDRYDFDTIDWIVRRIGEGITIGVLIVLACLVGRRPELLPRAVFEALFVFLLLATWNFRGWYLIWLVALTALLPLGWPAARTIAWTAGALAGYGLFIWVWHWWPVDFVTIQNIGVPIITGAAAILTVVEVGVWFGSRSRALTP